MRDQVPQWNTSLAHSGQQQQHPRLSILGQKLPKRCLDACLFGMIKCEIIASWGWGSRDSHHNTKNQSQYCFVDCDQWTILTYEVDGWEAGGGGDMKTLQCLPYFSLNESVLRSKAHPKSQGAPRLSSPPHLSPAAMLSPSPAPLAVGLVISDASW